MSEQALTEDERELLRLAERVAAWKSNAMGDLLAHYRKAKALECVVCGCGLLPDEEPPRCLDCPSGED